MSDYYKSLITDDEVIKELIKESKRREGKLPTEATRLKPNLNFFQRTVNSLVSNNTRIDKSQDSFKTEYLKDCTLEKSETSDDSPNKANIDYAFEREIVLQTKINFVKSSDAFSNALVGRAKKKIEIKKINFVGKAAPAFNMRSKGSSTKNTNKKHTTQKLKLGDSSSDLQDNVLILRLGDKYGKTTCNTIGTEHDKSKSEKLNTNDVICISSDDGSVEVLSNGSEDTKIKTKVKTQVKRRRRKMKNQLDEECGKRPKRKKHKKKKKHTLDKG